MYIEMRDEILGPSNFVDLLLLRAASSAHKAAYTYLEDGDEIGESITYVSFAQRVLALAAFLQQRFSKRDRVLLLHPASVDYMVAFFACLCAGIIAVPLFPPRGTKRNVRLEAVARDCKPRAALISSKQREAIHAAIAASPDLAALNLLCSDVVSTADERAWSHPDVNGDTVAFLQYTSGSTGEPKGVTVSHANLVHNERMIQTGIRSDGDANFVSWLPIFHDMGMVGNMLHTFWLGSECVFMAPAAFLQRPLRWLQAVSRFRARVSGGPNFAYDLCVDKIAEADRHALDLSGWQTAFTGAEPIRQTTLARFAKAFAPHGFSGHHFFPCYGMAETTLIVSGSASSASPKVMWVDKTRLMQGQIVETPPDTGQPLVGCGRPLTGQTVRIVDPLTQMLCPAGSVGEIWVAGPNVSRGYWERPAVNEEVFNARIVGSDEGPFLRTGDLGFLDDGLIYVTGRIKDVIIVRGANHYPQDIEATVEAADVSINKAGAAAFGLLDATGERVVVVAEIARTSLRKIDPVALAGKIRRLVLEQREILLDDVLLVRPGVVPKSSSGKVQRSQCRALYLAKGFDAVSADNRSLATSL